MAKLRIKKNDTVMIITGKDKGKTGVVSEVYPKDNKVVVEGLNIISKCVKAKTAQDKSGIIKKSAPINASNVMLICPETSKPTRVEIKTEVKDGKKVKLRISKKSGKVIELSSDIKKKSAAKKATKEETSTKKKAVRKKSEKVEG